MPSFRIAVLDDYQHIAFEVADWSPLALRAEIVVFDDTLSGVPELIQRLAGFDAVVLMRERTKFPAELIRQLPRLKLLTTMGQRNAAIDLAAAQQHGVCVSGTLSAGSSLSTATLAWTLILALTRGLITEAGSVRQGGWQRGLGIDIEGLTLGLVGLGRIGAQMATIATSFGMKTIAWSPNLTVERAQAAGAQLVGKTTLFETADFVSLHLVLSDRTRGIVDDAAIRQMKPSAFLINTARGPLVDDAALIAALSEGRIAGAGLDVFNKEPLDPDHPFRSLPNVLATPHIGYVTEGGYRTGYTQMIEDIVSFLDGAPIRRLGLDQG